MSEVHHRNGHVGIFPHLIDRAKPGIIGVRKNGKRFVNEAGSYPDYVIGLQQATPKGEECVSWLIADHPTLRRYGIGYAKPFPFQLARIRSAYLQRGKTILNCAACVDADSLERTIAAYNEHAANGGTGIGRGTTVQPGRRRCDREAEPVRRASQRTVLRGQGAARQRDIRGHQDRREGAR